MAFFILRAASAGFFALFIAPPTITISAPRFTASAAVSEMGVRGLLDAAKALAMTVVDLVASPGVVSKVKEEFKRGK